MARIRTIKPSFFRHELLFEAETESGLPIRLAFCGLWTACDREGRFQWKPRALKLDCLPYDDVDFNLVLETLVKYGFVVKYSIGEDSYGTIPSWDKHQHINQREQASELPPPDEAGAVLCAHVHAHGEGKGREGNRKGKEGKEVVAREKVRSPNTKGTRWPPDAIIPEDWLARGSQSRTDNGLQTIDLRAEALKFANYWASKSGGSATKLDWKRTWVNWCLTAKGLENHGLNGQSRKNSTTRTLERLAEQISASGKDQTD